ncbi:MAG: type IV pilus modification protein PilV [Acidiferrobacteraceae bacterium]|jgi:type IV pilus assembly protein PilV
MTNQRGFTLTEVLIAVLVLAVGLLGLAGLQLAGMKSNHSAYLRSQATIVAYDLLDRMRADPAGFTDRQFVMDTSADSGNPQFEAWEHTLLSLDLPPPADGGSQGAVDCRAGNGCGNGNCEVVVRWDDSRGEHASAGGGGRDAANMAYRVCSRLPGPS